MNLTFKAKMMKEWTLTEDTIIVGNKKIGLFDLTNVKHTPIKNPNSKFLKSNGVIQVFFGTGAFDFETLAYPPEQYDDGMKAAEYILNAYGNENVRIEIEKRKEIEEKGFRKRCKVCGKIMCYTLADLEENKRLTKSGMWSAIGALGGALAGNHTMSAVSNQSAENQISRIVDYDKCPSCGARDLVDISDEDIANINSPQVVQASATISSADELKKFKELLDSGIITQEEFDAKKKQLLGL